MRPRNRRTIPPTIIPARAVETTPDLPTLDWGALSISTLSPNGFGSDWLRASDVSRADL
jgi:hypothetical protein